MTGYGVDALEEGSGDGTPGFGVAAGVKLPCEGRMICWENAFSCGWDGGILRKRPGVVFTLRSVNSTFAGLTWFCFCAKVVHATPKNK